ncbi:MAG: ketopantoate reductase family protein [Pseudomonadota bacterium]
MNLTVIGPGAVGLLWAARLARAGASLTILDHRPERAALLTAEGIRLEDAQGETHLVLPVSADPAQALAGCRVALVCVKAYHTREVARTLAAHLPPSARALTLQNGAGNVEALVEALGAERVLGGITSEGATLLGPGRARHAGQGQTHLGPALGPPDALCAELASLFKQAGFACQVAQGVQNLIWTKLIINVGINALTALLGVPNGRLLELPAAKALMERAVGEALAVGQALGVNFLHQDMPGNVAEVARRTAQNISSMLQDARAGRRTEVEFINGHVVRAGQGVGLACPVNQTLTDLVLAQEQNQA